MVVGRTLKKDRKEGSSCERTFEGIRDTYEKVGKDIVNVWALCMKFLGKALTSCGGSSPQSMELEESLCRMFARARRW